MKAHSHSMFPTRNGVYVISATKLASFTDCLAGFFLRYVFRYPVRPHVSTLIGSAVHRTIDYRWRHFKQTGEDVYPIEPVYDFFLQEAWREQQDDLQRRADALGVPITAEDRGISDQDRRKGLAMAVLYRLTYEEIPEHTEYEFLVPYPNAREPLCYLYGFYDQLYPWGFIDLKSNYTLPTVASLASNIQFILYAHVFEYLYGKPLTRGYWYHLRTGQKVTFYPLQDDQRRLFTERLQTLTRFLYMIDTDAERRGITVPPTTDMEMLGTESVGEAATLPVTLPTTPPATPPATPPVTLPVTLPNQPILSRRPVQPYIKSYFQSVMNTTMTTGSVSEPVLCRWCTTPALCRHILSQYTV